MSRYFFVRRPKKNIEKIDGDAPDKKSKIFTVRRMEISRQTTAKSTLIQFRATSTESLTARVLRVVSKDHIASTLKLIPENNR